MEQRKDSHHSDPVAEEQEEHDHDVAETKSDTSVELATTRDEQGQQDVKHNARRIPLARKVHWPSERTLQHQLPGGTYRSSPRRRLASHLIVENEQEERDRRSQKERQDARRSMRNDHMWQQWAEDETAVSDQEDTPRTSRASSPEVRGRRRSSQRSRSSVDPSHVRDDWYETDVADMPMQTTQRQRPKSRERSRHRNQRSPDDLVYSDSSDGMTTGESTDEDEIRSSGLGSAFVGMLGLSQGDRKLRRGGSGGDKAEKGEANEGPFRRFGSRRKNNSKRKKRRWSHNALFRRDSASSVRSGRSSMSGWSGMFDRSSREDHRESQSSDRSNHDTDKPRVDKGAGNLQSEKDAKDDADANLATSENPSDSRVQETGRSEDTEANNRGEGSSPRSSIQNDELLESHVFGPTHTHHSELSSIRSNMETEHQRQRKHMKKDLDAPYIPAGRKNVADAVEPSTRLGLAQAWSSALDTVFAFFRGEDDIDIDHTGQYRSIAALIITTQGLAGIASPTLSKIAPASGKESETNRGLRKLSEYSNPREEYIHKVEDIVSDMLEDEDEKVGGLSKKTRADVTEKAMRKADDQVRKKPMRGKRRQKEIRITRHPTETLQRQDFVVNLAKALIKYVVVVFTCFLVLRLIAFVACDLFCSFGAPTHSVEGWLEATSDALQVKFSFIYLPAILILTFRDQDTKSSDVLLLRPAGSLDLYRLSLVHKVYRLVVHDVISVTSGTRALRRILKRVS